MAKNFQTDNHKFKEKTHRTDIYNHQFNSSIKAIGDNESKGFKANLHKWVEFVSFMRWFPDLFWDLITPEEGALIRLDLDQRVFLRSLSRFVSTYGVFPRGFGKTMLEVMGLYHTAIFFPNTSLSMTAQTKENAAKILKEKHDELVTAFPLLQNEISKVNYQKEMFECHFHSGSRIDILVNNQSTKGQRRKRLNIEEAALLNNELFEDVLEPVVNVPRRTIGKEALIDPEELNGQINFFSTSGFRGSSEHIRSIQMVKEMAELKGKIVIGSDWQLAESCGRGETKSQIMEKMEKLSPIAFAQNYKSQWIGAVDGALVQINKVMDLRTLTRAEIQGDGKSEYIISMDVARSENTNNNQSSFVVLKLKRSKDGKILRIQLVNLVNIRNGLTFKAQTVILKRLKYAFNASVVVVDSNGLGAGIIDECVQETIDTKTNVTYPAWKPMNTEQEAESLEYEECLYDLKATGINHDIILAFINTIESKKLELLERRSINANFDIDDTDFFEGEVLPFVQTDMLLGEIANLKLKQQGSGKYTIEKNVRRIDKDRYSALAYGLILYKIY